MRTVKVGTRQSQLALWQTNHVINKIKENCPQYSFEIIPIRTKGDKILDVPLAKIGDKGLFTKELETALLEKGIDFAVHSMKDLPSILAEGLMVGAMTKRHDPRDVLISKNMRKLAELPLGAVIGTSALRRKSQLLYHRPDLIIKDLRGNIDTRIKKLETEGLDAIILAAAGVERLGRQEIISEWLAPTLILPGVGQGSIGVEVRTDDEEIMNIVRTINDSDTEYCILSERALLRALEGGCQVPIGALALIEQGSVSLEAMIARTDGKELIRDSIRGTVERAEKLGEELAFRLKELGGEEILSTIR